MFNRSLVRIALVAALAVTLVVVPAAVAGKGGGGKGGGGNSGQTSGSGTLSVKMVTDRNANGAPNWSDQITFDVYTTATDKPWVLLNCYQSGTWVSTMSHGFFEAYPWSPNYTLASGGWTSGAASCTATLYMVMSNGKRQNLATLTFAVAA